ncbi:MAG: hypothetical protein B7Z15_10940, partial [Rhizobiales bacterium 32-66-8]
NPQGSDAGHPGYGAVHAPFALSVRFRTALVPTPNWGRIGTGGQSLMETFDTPEEADGAFGRLERTKRRRGYSDPSERK